MCHPIHTRCDSRLFRSASRLSPSWSPTRMVASPSATTWSSTKSLGSKTGGMSSHTAFRVSLSFPSVLTFQGTFKCQGFASELNPQYQWAYLCHSVTCTPAEMYTCSASQVFPPTHCNNYRLDCFLLWADHSETDKSNGCIHKYKHFCDLLQRLPESHTERNCVKNGAKLCTEQMTFNLLTVTVTLDKT